jgi:hypothetical protein
MQDSHQARASITAHALLMHKPLHKIFVERISCVRATLQPFTKRIAGITNLKFVYDEEPPILQRNIEVFISGEQ